MSTLKKILCLGACLFLIGGIVRAADDQDLTKRNVVVLLDSSGSMGGHKIAEAKSALREVLKHMPQDMNIGLLTFYGWVYPLQARDDSKLIPAIDGVNTPNNTPLGPYIMDAGNALLEQRKKQLGYGTYQLLVLTDGQENQGVSLKVTAPQVVQHGIKLDVIGVEMGESHPLARYAHSYRAAKDGAALSRAVKDVLVENVTKDSTTSSDFDGAELLDAEVAKSIIQALSSSQKSSMPISERPPSFQVEEQQQQGGQVNNPSSNSGGYALKVAGITVLIVILIFLVIWLVDQLFGGRY